MSPALSGVLLAGGRGSRMGADKALVPFEGEALGLRIVRVLQEVCEEVVVASGDGERLAALGLPQVADPIPGCGPLGGIVAGLAAARGDLVAIVAVDMPFANAALLRLLGERWAGEDIVAPVTRRGVEPLHAIYRRGAAEPLGRLLREGRLGVIEALATLRVREVGEQEWRRADPSGRFAVNLNSPEDALSAAERGPGVPGYDP